MKFGRKLESLRGQEIAVVMIDGYIYRGILHDFDDEMMLLTDVDETNNSSMDWKAAEKELMEEQTESSKSGKVTKSKSDEKENEKRIIKWRPVALPEVILRLPMVLRIWPWNVLTKEDVEKRRMKRTEEKPVYYMNLMGLNM